MRSIQSLKKLIETNLRKAGIMLIGIFFSSLGVSLSIKSELGATPIGVCPAVFSPWLSLSTGTGMAILLGLFFLAQILILRKDFQPIQFMQLVVTGVYGGFVDFFTRILSSFSDGALWQQTLYCGSGILFLAFGVFIMLRVDFFMLPQDALVYVLSQELNASYGKVKITLDVALTAIAAIGSWVLYRQAYQVGIGTIAAAIAVGKIISALQDFKGINDLFDRAISET